MDEKIDIRELSQDWDVGLDISNLESHTQPQLNKYIMSCIVAYARRKYRDEALWEAFGEDFRGWTKEIFEKASDKAIRDLRDHLRNNGVFVFKQRFVSISGELTKVLQERNPHKWTPDEIREQITSAGTFNSRLAPGSAAASAAASATISRAFSEPIDPPKPAIAAVPLPPVAQSETARYGREIGILAKRCDEDKKYGGEVDESLDLTLGIFFNLCAQAGVPPESYATALTTSGV